MLEQMKSTFQVPLYQIHGILISFVDANATPYPHKWQFKCVKMAPNIEKIAKETILLFFLETTEPHLAKFTEDELTKVSRWLSKITRLDLYSMRTHLLLLYHVLKRGQLLPPFDKDPATVTLPRFRAYNSYIDVDDPNLDQVLKSVTRCSAHATRHQYPPLAAAAAARKSRKDVFHIPCRRPTAAPQQPDPNQTYTLRSRSQPRYQGDFDEPTAEGKRSRSVPRADNLEAYADCQEEVLDEEAERNRDCCPPGYNPQTSGWSHSMCLPCKITPQRDEIGATSSFYEENFHLPDFPVSPIRKTEENRFWPPLENDENLNSCMRRSRIPVLASRYSTRTTAQPQLQPRTSSMRVVNTQCPRSSRVRSGITLVILSPMRQSSSNISLSRRSSVK